MCGYSNTSINDNKRNKNQHRILHSEYLNYCNVSSDSNQMSAFSGLNDSFPRCIDKYVIYEGKKRQR